MTYKAIIIDDSPLHRFGISFLMKIHPKLKFIGAYSDPHKGIQAAQEHNVDIVFLDILLQNVTAFELLNEFQIPAKIIMHSSWEKFAAKAKEYGVYHFLAKPMRKKAFNTIINSAIWSIEERTSEILNHTPNLMPNPSALGI